MKARTQPTRAATPLGLRLFERSGIEPLWLGLAAGLVLVALVLSYEASLGHLSAVFTGDMPTVAIRAPTAALLLIGLAPAGMYYQARWTERNLELLAREIDGEVVVHSHASDPSRLAGIGAGVMFVVLFVLPSGSSVEVAMSNPLPHKIYPWIMVGALGWLQGRLLHAIVMDALTVSRLAARLRRIDLFDPSGDAKTPFVDQGQRSALLLIVVFSVSSIVALSPGNVVAGSIFVLALSSTLAVVSLSLPVRGIRRRIRSEKRSQLATLRQQIDSIRGDVLAGKIDRDTVALLPGLLALESRIEAVREWPFDASNVLRVGIYLLIGLGSWVGAAAVERLLDWSLR